MDANFKALLTWDNILLAASAIGFSGGLGFILLTSFRNNPLDSSKSESKADLPKQKIKLEDLSQNWINPKKQKKEQIFLKDLYYRWRTIDNKNIPEDDNAVVHTFKNDRVRKFFYKYVHEKTYFKNARKQRSVVVQILHLLDEEGDCPSVVFSIGDPDGGLTSTTHGILQRVSLLNHSLNVAEIICQSIKKDSPQGAMLMAPDALICALGHDLGKLPSFNADGYTHGSHPLTSDTIIQNVKDFKLLKNREEIENAIKRHHHPNIEQEKSALLRLLWASDTKARTVEQDVVIGLDKERFENQRYVYMEKEESQGRTTPAPVVKTTSGAAPSQPEEEMIEELAQEPEVFEDQEEDQEIQTESGVAAEQEEVFFDVPGPQQEKSGEPQKKPDRPKKNKQPGATGIEQPASPEAIAKAKADVAAAWKEQELLHGIQDPTPELQVEQAKTVALDGWFSPGKFLDDLEKQVNQVDRMRICAFSLPTGKIYVAPETMVRLIQKQAKSAKIGWLTELDDYTDLTGNKNQNFPKIWATLLVGIVDLFRSQGFIDACIRPGFYGNHFVVTSEPVPTTGTRFFTVFLANAFKLTIPQFESKKIANRVTNIKDVKLAKTGGFGNE